MSTAKKATSHREDFEAAPGIACIECFFIPFGTILGVFTSVMLSRESVKESSSTA
jgi:hypothetical protein